MPNVTVFRTELLPRSETFVLGQARGLRRFTPAFAGLRRVPGGIPLDGSPVATLTPGDRLADKLHRRFFLQTGAAPGFTRAVRAQAPDLIHAHFAVDAAAVLPLQRRLGIPLVVSLHGYDVTSSDAALAGFAPGRAYLRRKRELHERASRFICVSDHIRAMALRRGFPEAKLVTQAIGIDVDAFQTDPAAAREPLILFVGRLVEKKGCAHLLRAMRTVEQAAPEAELVIVGDGPLRGALEQEAAGLRHCRFLGAQPAGAVVALMRRAAVLAAPSIVAGTGDTEGLPIVLCEAQASGLPVAGFHGPGTSEAVADGETALLADPGDEAGLADRITRLLLEPARAAQLGAAGRARARRLFNLATQSALLEERYLEALR